MKSKKMFARSSCLVAASLLACSLAQSASAAGPVAVAPARSGNLVADQPASPVSFSVDLGAGYLSGESKELVYWPNQNNHKASELIWEIEDLYMIGFGASLKVRNWMSVNFAGWVKATDGEGSMDDYDWSNVGGDWTDWSRHENTDVTEGSILDLNAEFAFLRTDNVALKGIVGYKRDNFAWEASGGQYTYSEEGFRDTRGTFSNNLSVIGYEQTFTVPYIGVGFAAKFNALELSGRFVYSPLAEGEATDNHYLRNLVTYDEGEEGEFFGLDVAGTFSFTDHLALKLGYSYQRYDEMQGDSEWEYRDEGVVYYFEDGAGMSQTSSLFKVVMQYTF